MKPSPQTTQKLLDKCGLSEGQIGKLEQYVSLILRWQKAINLVSPSTLPEIWERHILDSAQLVPLIKARASTGTYIIDLGSGGGLPGLVLAIAGVDHITMIESDKRKCVFLREVSRETKLANVTVINERIENVPDIKADFITARALAPLNKLIEWSTPFLSEQSKMLFMKGQDAKTELAALPISLQENVELLPSITDQAARIIIL